MGSLLKHRPKSETPSHVSPMMGVLGIRTILHLQTSTCTTLCKFQ